MPRFKFSVSQRRRALAKKVEQLDRLESKVTITEPISAVGVCIPALRTLAGIGLLDAAQFSSYPTALANRAEEAARRGARNARPQIHLPAGSSDVLPIAVATRPTADSSGSSGSVVSQTPAPSGGDVVNHGPDRRLAEPVERWRRLDRIRHLGPVAAREAPGGGAAMAPRGGSGAAFDRARRHSAVESSGAGAKCRHGKSGRIERAALGAGARRRWRILGRRRSGRHGADCHPQRSCRCSQWRRSLREERPFSDLFTFTYNCSNQLQSIKDPASRLASFTVSGGDLTAVEYPDGSTWDHGYDSGGRMTSVTEPSSAGEPTKITTITYDNSERVGTITRADSTTETYSAAQEQGWTNSGTSGSPAASTLLAEVGSTYTDPLGDVTTLRPDWCGMGLTDQSVNALSNVSTYDRDSDGLVTIAIDPMNQISQYAYDTHGNVTQITYPDLSTVSYGTYNSFAEPSSMTDQLSRTTTYTYDGQGRRRYALGENGQGSVPHAAPPFPLDWEHIPDKRLFALTADGSTEYWSDNPTRYLVVETDPATGEIKPVLKRGRPVYLWLCREEREAR